LRGKRETLVDEYEGKVGELRTRLQTEKEEALDRERERTGVKLHEQYERLEN
jgi:hypothetical protein